MSLRGVFKALGSTSAQTQVAAARRLAADPSVTDAAQAVKVLGALVDAAGACDAKAVPWLVKAAAALASTYGLKGFASASSAAVAKGAAGAALPRVRLAAAAVIAATVKEDAEADVRESLRVVVLPLFARLRTAAGAATRGAHVAVDRVVTRLVKGHPKLLTWMLEEAASVQAEEAGGAAVHLFVPHALAAVAAGKLDASTWSAALLPALLDSLLRSTLGAAHRAGPAAALCAGLYAPLLAALPPAAVAEQVLPALAKAFKTRSESVLPLIPALFASLPDGSVPACAALDEGLFPGLATHASNGARDDLREAAVAAAKAVGSKAANAAALARWGGAFLDVIVKKRASVPLWQSRHGLMLALGAIAGGAAAGVSGGAAAAKEVLAALCPLVPKETHEGTRAAMLAAAGQWFGLGTAAGGALPAELTALLVPGLKTTSAVGAGTNDGYAEALYLATNPKDASSSFDVAATKAVAASVELTTALGDFVAKAVGAGLGAGRRGIGVPANLVYAYAVLMRCAAVEKRVADALTMLKITEAAAGAAGAGAGAASAVKKPATPAAAAAKPGAAKPSGAAAAAAASLGLGLGAAKTFDGWDVLTSAVAAPAALLCPALVNPAGRSVAEVAALQPLLLALAQTITLVLVEPALRDRCKAVSKPYWTAVVADLTAAAGAGDALEDYRVKVRTALAEAAATPVPGRHKRPTVSLPAGAAAAAPTSSPTSKDAGEAGAGAKKANGFFSAIVNLLAHPLWPVRQAMTRGLAETYKALAAGPAPAADAVPLAAALPACLLHALWDRVRAVEAVGVPTSSSLGAPREVPVDGDVSPPPHTGLGDGPSTYNALLAEAREEGKLTRGAAAAAAAAGGAGGSGSAAAAAGTGAAAETGPTYPAVPTPAALRYAFRAILAPQPAGVGAAPVHAAVDVPTVGAVVALLAGHPCIAGGVDDPTAATSAMLGYEGGVVAAPAPAPAAATATSGETASVTTGHGGWVHADPRGRTQAYLWAAASKTLAASAGTPAFLATPAAASAASALLLRSRGAGVWAPSLTSRVAAGRALACLMSDAASGGRALVLAHVLPTLLTTLQECSPSASYLTHRDAAIWKARERTVALPPSMGADDEEGAGGLWPTSKVLEAALARQAARAGASATSPSASAGAASGGASRKGGARDDDDDDAWLGQLKADHAKKPATGAAAPSKAAAAAKDAGKDAEDPLATVLVWQNGVRKRVRTMHELAGGALGLLGAMLRAALAAFSPLVPTLLPALLPLLGCPVLGGAARAPVRATLRAALVASPIAPIAAAVPGSLLDDWTRSLQLLQTVKPPPLTSGLAVAVGGGAAELDPDAPKLVSGTVANTSAAAVAAGLTDALGATGADLYCGLHVLKRLLTAVSARVIGQATVSQEGERYTSGAASLDLPLPAPALHALVPVLRGVLTVAPPLPLSGQAAALLPMHTTLPDARVAGLSPEWEALHTPPMTIEVELSAAVKGAVALTPALLLGASGAAAVALPATSAVEGGATLLSAGDPRTAAYVLACEASVAAKEPVIRRRPALGAAADPAAAVAAALAAAAARKTSGVGTPASDSASLRLLRQSLAGTLLFLCRTSPRMSPAPDAMLKALVAGTPTGVPGAASQVMTPGEVAAVLMSYTGLLSAFSHVRAASLAALDISLAAHVGGAATPATAPLLADVTLGLWIAAHDVDEDNAAHAQLLWSRHGLTIGDRAATVTALVAQLAGPDEPPRLAAGRALAALFAGEGAAGPCPAAVIEGGLKAALHLFNQHAEPAAVAAIPTGWKARAGVLAALAACAERKVLSEAGLQTVLPFLIQRGFADPDTAAVRPLALALGRALVDAYGATHAVSMLSVFEGFLDKGSSSPLAATSEMARDSQREGCVVLLGSAAKFLAPDDPKMTAIFKVLLETLNTPSESVQRSVSQCIAPLAKVRKEEAPQMLATLLDRLLRSGSYAVSRGAAFGLAGAVKGYGLMSLKNNNVMAALEEAAQDPKKDAACQGAFFAFAALCESLGMLFEPYVIRVVPYLLKAFGEGSPDVREAATATSQALMAILTGHGVKLVMPAVLAGLSESAWRSKQGSIHLLGSMASCAPKQLSQCLPQIVPKLIEAFEDPHPKVQAAGKQALQNIGRVIKNPEVAALVPALLAAITDAGDKTREALAKLAATDFVHAIDPPSLALIVPILRRGLLDRSTPTKVSASLIAGNMCSLIGESRDLVPYVPALMTNLKKTVVDPIPDVRAASSKAMGSLLKGLGEEEVPDLLPWLLETMKSPTSTVERSGAAQGLAEVLVALGHEKLFALFDEVLGYSDHPKPGPREGILWFLVFLPSVLGRPFARLLPAAFPCAIAALADDAEAVRDVALRAAQVMVKTHAKTDAATGLLPSLEMGMLSPSWRVRKGAIALLGDLLTVISGASHYTPAVVAGNTVGPDAAAPAAAAAPKAAAPAPAPAGDGLIVTMAKPKPAAEEEEEVVVEEDEGEYDEEDDFDDDEGSDYSDEEESEEESEEEGDAGAEAEAKVSDGGFYKKKQKQAAAIAAKRERSGKPKGSSGGGGGGGAGPEDVGRSRASRRAAEAAIAGNRKARRTEEAIAAASGPVVAALDETFSSAAMDAASQAISRTLGLATRNRLLASLYFVRADTSAVVRQAALKAWKDLVQNTPRTLREVLPALMGMIIEGLAGSLPAGASGAALIPGAAATNPAAAAATKLLGSSAAAAASAAEERRLAAGRTLGEVVRKLGERVLPDIVPILRRGLASPQGTTRQGVCLGLAEVLAASTRRQIDDHVDELVPSVRDALCDPLPEVRDAASRAFNVLQKVLGNEAIERVLPSLLSAMSTSDREKASLAMAGLQCVVGARARDVLPTLLPRLTRPPLGLFQARALAAVASVSGNILHFHVPQILGAIVGMLAGDQTGCVAGKDDAVEAVSERLGGPLGEACAAIFTAVEDNGVAWTVDELIKYVVFQPNDPTLPLAGIGTAFIEANAQRAANRRRIGAWLLGKFVLGATADWTTQVPLMLKELVGRMADTHPDVHEAAIGALLALVNGPHATSAPVGVEELADHLDYVRSSLSALVTELQYGRKGAGSAAGEGGAIYLPGLAVPKALDAFLPLYQRALMHGSHEAREVAATGLGELVEVTPPDSLKSYYVKITGPLIRVAADKFPWQVKAAILSTLQILMDKGGVALKPFQPQLQTTFVKALTDPVQAVRARGASALGRLMPLVLRVDPLVSELLAGVAASSGGVQESQLAALATVLARAGDRCTGAARARVLEMLMDGAGEPGSRGPTPLHSFDGPVRRLAGAALGAALRLAEADQVRAIITKLAIVPGTPGGDGVIDTESGGTGSNPVVDAVADGRTAAIVGILRYAPAAAAPFASSHIAPHLLTASKADAPVLRELAARGIGWALAHSAREPLPPVEAGATPSALAAGSPTGPSRRWFVPDPADFTAPEVAQAWKAPASSLVSALTRLLKDTAGGLDVRKEALIAAKRMAKYSPRAAERFAKEVLPCITPYAQKETVTVPVFQFAAERALVYWTQSQTGAVIPVNAKAGEGVLAAVASTEDGKWLGEYARRVLRRGAQAEESDDEGEADL